MKRQSMILIFLLVIASGWLGWMVIDLSVENDGLRQMADLHKGSIRSLLRFSSVATRCDTPPEVVASAVGTGVRKTSAAGGAQVSKLAFDARFEGGRVSTIRIVDVDEVVICPAPR